MEEVLAKAAIVGTLSAFAGVLINLLTRLLDTNRKHGAIILLEASIGLLAAGLVIGLLLVAPSETLWHYIVFPAAAGGAGKEGGRIILKNFRRVAQVYAEDFLESQRPPPPGSEAAPPRRASGGEAEETGEARKNEE